MAVNDWCGYLAENQRIINVEELVCCSLAQHATKPKACQLWIKKYIHCITLISVGECLNNHNKKQRTIKNYNTLQRSSSQAAIHVTIALCSSEFCTIFYRAMPRRAQYCKSSVRLSVCSVEVYRDHAGWNTSKIVSWLTRLSSLCRPPTSRIYSREHPEILARIGVGYGKSVFRRTNTLISLKWGNIGP